MIEQEVSRTEVEILRAQVEAVLSLHGRDPIHEPGNECHHAGSSLVFKGFDGERWCARCPTGEGYCVRCSEEAARLVLWPCPTIRAIQEAGRREITSRIEAGPDGIPAGELQEWLQTLPGGTPVRLADGAFIAIWTEEAE